MKKLISLMLVLALALAAGASLAEQPAATPLDKAAFDALLADGPVASDGWRSSAPGSAWCSSPSIFSRIKPFWTI